MPKEDAGFIDTFKKFSEGETSEDEFLKFIEKKSAEDKGRRVNNQKPKGVFEVIEKSVKEKDNRKIPIKPKSATIESIFEIEEELDKEKPSIIPIRVN